MEKMVGSTRADAVVFASPPPLCKSNGIYRLDGLAAKAARDVLCDRALNDACDKRPHWRGKPKTPAVTAAANASLSP
jgi:hypothetical protein